MLRKKVRRLLFYRAKKLKMTVVVIDGIMFFKAFVDEYKNTAFLKISFGKKNEMLFSYSMDGNSWIKYPKPNVVKKFKKLYDYNYDKIGNYADINLLRKLSFVLEKNYKWTRFVENHNLGQRLTSYEVIFIEGSKDEAVKTFEKELGFSPFTVIDGKVVCDYLIQRVAEPVTITDCRIKIISKKEMVKNE